LNKLILIIVTFVCTVSIGLSISHSSYERGLRDAIERYEEIEKSQYKFPSAMMWQENPPTIYNKCWTTCEEGESVTWEEYVERYHASRMRLDNPNYDN